MKDTSATDFEISDSSFMSVLRFLGDHPKPVDDERAFEISLAKWKVVKKFLEENQKELEGMGTETCGLCMLHWSERERGSGEETACIGCPIAAKTGIGYCINTPFDEYMGAEDNFRSSGEDMLFIDHMIQAAQKEYDFLLALAEEHGFRMEG